MRTLILFSLLVVLLCSFQHETNAEGYLIPDDLIEELLFHRRQLVTDIYPQLMIVVDSSLAEKLGGNDEDIHIYIQRLMGNIQRVYDSSPQPRVHFRIADIYICKTSDECSYLNRNKKEGKLEVDNELFMVEMADWARAKRSKMVAYDLMMTLTSLEMCRSVNTDGSCPRGSGLAGKAYLGGVCGSSNVGIATDDGGFGGVKTIAHEMAHLFGAQHDGASGGGEDCSGADGYIMGGSGNPQNFFRLSPCSIKSIAKHVSSSRRQCLLNDNPGKYELDHTLQGSLTSPDDQCKMRYGPDSKNCPFFGDIDKEICEKHWCFFPSTGTCRTSGAAFSGTPCDMKDSNKHCYMSYGCVDKSFRAPVTDVDISDVVTPAPPRDRPTARMGRTTRSRPQTTADPTCVDAYRTHLKITSTGTMTNCTENYRLYPETFCGTGWVRSRCCATARANCPDRDVIGY